MSSRFFVDQFKKFGIDSPVLHVVLGSGLGSAFSEVELSKEWKEAGSLKFSDVPGMPSTGVQGHAGVFKYFQNIKSKKSVCFQAGRIHGYEGHSPRDVVKPLLWAFQAGTKRFLLTNAAGSLNSKFLPGSVMMISDQVNFTGTNPLIGNNPIGDDSRPLGPRFPDMSQIYDKAMRNFLRDICEKRGMKVHEGVYLGLMGPAFETPAEVALFAAWGLGAVGMSTVWESIALKHAGATVAGLSVISNLGCGLSDQPLSHADVQDIGQKIGRQLLEALFDFAKHYANQ